MATSFQLIYENEGQLIKFIADHELAQYPTLLIQAYVSQMEDQELHTLRNTLLKHLPKAKLIGCNSRGEIIDGRVSERKPILTFTVFDKTNIHSNLFTIQEDTNGFQLGQTIVKELVNSETKVLIILASHHHSLLNEVLSGIYEWSPDIHIVGGVMAEEASHHSFIVTQQGITSHGIAVASLDNQNLYVKTMVNADWQEIGSTFTVTKSKNQRIYEIDGKKPVQVLKTYLGQGFIDRLPYSGLEFPLLIHRNGKQKEFFIIKEP
nr:FIST N-terminal domain-containing protein [Heyndrickxia oleronia]